MPAKRKTVCKKHTTQQSPANDMTPESASNVLGLDLLAYLQEGSKPLVSIDRLPKGVSKDLLSGKGIHQEKLEAARKGIPQHYEWADIGSSLFFQTNLLPLPQQNKHAKPMILVTVRNITSWAIASSGSNGFLRDGIIKRTFAQLLLAAREEEKKNISKALHDEIGSAAVILTSLISLVRASVVQGNKQQALIDLKELDQHVKRSIERIKNIIVSLRPIHLEQEGALVESILELLKNIGNYARLLCTFNGDRDLEEHGISDNVKILLYRVVQEALNNIVKHAQATHVHVALTRQQEKLRLVVQDDGIGFHPNKQVSIRHIGLLAMKDSVRFLGGKISIQSTLGKGTRIEVQCPCVVYEDQV